MIEWQLIYNHIWSLEIKQTWKTSDLIKLKHFDLATKCYVWQKHNTVKHFEDTIPTLKHGDGSIMLCRSLYKKDAYNFYKKLSSMQSKNRTILKKSLLANFQ